MCAHMSRFYYQLPYIFTEWSKNMKKKILSSSFSLSGSHPSLQALLPEPKLHLPLLDFIQSQVVDTHGHCADDFEIGSCWAEKALFVSFLRGFKALLHTIDRSRKGRALLKVIKQG